MNAYPLLLYIPYPGRLRISILDPISGTVNYMLDDEKRIRLSKKLSGVLRHYGPRYGLEINGDGWARIEEVVRVLRSLPGFAWVNKSHIFEVVRKDDKGRFEIKGEYIRALYGHSIRNINPNYQQVLSPPKVLYHGTPKRNLASIMTSGLLPGRRNWVHLTLLPEIAVETGSRYGGPLALLEIDTRCLQKKGIKVYAANRIVYLVKHVPPECIRVVKTV